jgi:pyruvate dehydrogenase E2 component (dihydrolipoamide acetyltransferase)
LASKEIRVPDLGNFKDVAVIDVLVRAGQTVEVDTPLITLETEKATMDVPSSDAGVIEKVHVNKGSLVSAGSLIATLTPAADGHDQAAAASAAAGAGQKVGTAATSGQVAPGQTASAPTASAPPPAAARAATAPASAAAPTRAPTSTSATAAAPAPAATPVAASATPAAVAAPSRAPSVLSEALPAQPGVSPSGAHASPSVRKFARELGVDLSRVRGSGQKERITAEDVKAFVKAALARAPTTTPSEGWPKVSVPDFAQFGPVEVKPLGRVQRISAQRVHASWVNLPHVTQFDEADITELEATRVRLKERAESAGVKLTLLAFVVLACVKALQKFPQFNASLDESGQNIVYKKYVHIGFAADTRQGLLVPVIRDANRKDVYEVARALAELSSRARAGQLTAAEMQGGSFTISSLGGIGGTAFTPIINAPEVAILGVSRASTRPVFHEGGFVPRLILPLSLSYDHRVIDGAAGARFITALTATLADPNALLEAVP